MGADYPVLGRQGWYAPEVWFSDWRGKEPVDFSTNVAPTIYYTGKDCKGLRMEQFPEVKAGLERGDTLRWGVDYYALFNISSFYFTQDFFNLHARRLLNGEVFEFKVFINQETGTLAYERIN